MRNFKTAWSNKAARKAGNDDEAIKEVTSKRKFKSEAFDAIHSAAAGMYRAGTIDKATLRDFDETCLAVTPPLAPAEIKQLREANKSDQGTAENRNT